MKNRSLSPLLPWDPKSLYWLPDLLSGGVLMFFLKFSGCNSRLKGFTQWLIFQFSNCLNLSTQCFGFGTMIFTCTRGLEWEIAPFISGSSGFVASDASHWLKTANIKLRVRHIWNIIIVVFEWTILNIPLYVCFNLPCDLLCLWLGIFIEIL